jgi:hypothetical protein
LQICPAAGGADQSTREQRIWKGLYPMLEMSLNPTNELIPENGGTNHHVSFGAGGLGFVCKIIGLSDFFKQTFPTIFTPDS